MPTRRIRSDSCARAASGHEAADPATTLMKSRRRIAFTKAGTTPNRTRLQQGFATDGMGSEVKLHSNNLELPMSALPPKADMDQQGCDVRFVLKADSCSAAKRPLFDDFIGAHKQSLRHGEAQHPGCREVDD